MKTLCGRVGNIRDWLDQNEDKLGSRGGGKKKSNITYNEGVKIVDH